MKKKLMGWIILVSRRILSKNAEIKFYFSVKYFSLFNVYFYAYYILLKTSTENNHNYVKFPKLIAYIYHFIFNKMLNIT